MQRPHHWMRAWIEQQHQILKKVISIHSIGNLYSGFFDLGNTVIWRSFLCPCDNHTFGFPGIWSKLKYQYPIPSNLHTVTKGLHVLYLYVSISLETTYNKISSVFVCIDLSCAGPLEKLTNTILNTELLIFYVDFSCQINLTSLTSSDILNWGKEHLCLKGMREEGVNGAVVAKRREE